MTKEFFFGRGDNPYTTTDVLGSVFLSFYDQQDAFEILDYWAWGLVPDDDLSFNAIRYTWNKALSRMIKALTDLEYKAFNKFGMTAYEERVSRHAGISYQRQLVMSLKERLEGISTPAQLHGQLTEIKVGLMQAWVIDIQLQTNSLELLAAKGEEFTRPRSRGCDALGNVILSLLQEHGKETKAKAVFKMLEDLVDPVNPHPTIQSVEDGVVYWRSARGNEKKTAFGSIENRLTEYKRMV